MKINPDERRTCAFQDIQCYPGDEFVMCKSQEKCEFQTPSSSIGNIYCDKPVISHDDAVASAERGKVLDEFTQLLDEHTLTHRTSSDRNVIQKSFIYNMIEELRQAGEP
jgi:hypothetical protein